MTRETKIGLLVTVSFLSLVGIVLYSKMKGGNRLSEDDGQAEINIPEEPELAAGGGKGSSPGAGQGEPQQLPGLIRQTALTGPNAEARPMQIIPGLPPVPEIKDKAAPSLASGASAGGTGSSGLGLAPWSREGTQKHTTPAGSGQPGPSPLPPVPGAAGKDDAPGGTTVAAGIPVPPVFITGDTKTAAAGAAGKDDKDLPGPLPGMGAGSAGRLTGVDAPGAAGQIKVPEPPPLAGAAAGDKKVEAPAPLPGISALAGVQENKDQIGGKAGQAAGPAPLPPAMSDARVDLDKPKPSASIPAREVAAQGIDPGAYAATSHPLPPVGTPAGAITPPIMATLPATAAGRNNFAAAQVESYDEETYRLRPGDTLETVSQHFYHTDKYAQALLRFNRDHPLADPSLRADRPRLQPEQAIYLPPTNILEKRYASVIPDLGVTAAPLAGREARPSPAATGVMQASALGSKTVSYTVKNGGEMMYDIAVRALGKGERWTEVRNLNGGYDPAYRVPAGTVLQLPADARP